jgi:UDP-glucose 4-epimerase
MNILITGCAGFFGHNLASRILQKYPMANITGVDNLLSGKRDFLRNLEESERFNFVEIDCRDLNQVEDLPVFNRIIHLAANSDIAAAMTNPTIDYELGIQTTHAMLEYARIHEVQEFVFSSGSGVYGEVPGKIFDENSFVGQPTSTYGATKLSSEALISAYSFMFGIKSTIFRFCNLVGKNQTHGVVFDFIHKLRLNQSELDVLGNGTQTKPYIHLDDAIEGIFIALEKQTSKFEVFNVSNTTATAVKEIAEMVVKRVGNSNTQINYGSADRGWKADIPNYLMSSKKLSNLGWKPNLNSIEAIEQSIEENLN